MFNKKIYAKEYYQKNKDKILSHNKKYRDAHQQSIKEYKERNKERRLSQTREWYKRNKDEVKQKNKEWRKEHPNNVKEWDKKYRQNNSIKYNARQYSYRNKQRDDKCLNCDSIEDLHFHHIDYKQKIGITLCKRCHNGIHNKS